MGRLGTILSQGEIKSRVVLAFPVSYFLSIFSPEGQTAAVRLPKGPE